MFLRFDKAPLFLLVVLFFFGLRVIQIQQGWITDDSVLYFEMARLISAGEWQAAYAMFQWPLYPALIALIHQATSLTLQHSGNLLSVLFFSITGWALTQIVSRLGGGSRAQLFSVIMLLGSTYITGDVMPMATRDQGYWAMMSLAIWQLIVFHQQGQLRAAILWQIFAIAGTLFRIEGAVLLMALPWVVFTLPLPRLKQKIIGLFLTFSVLVVVFLGGLFLLLMLQIMGITHLDITEIGRLKELFTGLSDITQNINQNIVHRVDVMRDDVIGEPFKEFAWFTFILSLLSIGVVKCILVAGWTPAILTIFYARASKPLFETIAIRLLLAVLITVWITSCLIISKVNILSGRYVVLFGLVLVTLSAVIFDDQLKHWPTSSIKRKSLLIICAGIVVIGIIGNILPKPAEHSYERDAVLYVKSQLKPTQRALYTTPRQRFYAEASYEGRHDAWDYLVAQIDKNTMNHYEYLVIRLDSKPGLEDKEAYLKSHLSEFELDRIFYGHKKKKRILVFKKAK